MPTLTQTENRNRRVPSFAALCLLAFATITAGIFDLLWRNFDSAHQPIQALGDSIPGVAILACITGVWMVAAGMAILWRPTAKNGALALAVIYGVFAFFWLPRYYNVSHALGLHARFLVGITAGLGTQIIVVAAAVLIYASFTSGDRTLERALLIARWIFGLSAIDFGLGHFTAIKDDSIFVPRGMPGGQEVWVVATGICFVIAGLAILTRIQDVLAARLLALMFLTFNVLALPQFILADRSDHAAWGGNAYNLAAVASCWILADFLAADRRQARQ